MKTTQDAMWHTEGFLSQQHNEVAGAASEENLNPAVQKILENRATIDSVTKRAIEEFAPQAMDDARRYLRFTANVERALRHEAIQRANPESPILGFISAHDITTIAEAGEVIQELAENKKIKIEESNKIFKIVCGALDNVKKLNQKPQKASQGGMEPKSLQ